MNYCTENNSNSIADNDVRRPFDAQFNVAQISTSMEKNSSFNLVFYGLVLSLGSAALGGI